MIKGIIVHSVMEKCNKNKITTPGHEHISIEHIIVEGYHVIPSKNGYYATYSVNLFPKKKAFWQA